MRYLDEVRRLSMPLGRYAIFGSGPLAVRGLRENSDIDILVKPDLWSSLTGMYETKEGKNGLYIQIGRIEIWDQWKPWFDDIGYMIDKADIIDGIPFIRLEDMLEGKKRMNRKKDQEDIRLIEDYLSSSE